MIAIQAIKRIFENERIKHKRIMKKENNCQKEKWHDCCCCNCANHLEDFHHCTTLPKLEGVEGCVCSTHKGWICRMAFDDSDRVYYHSGWSEHGMCEMHTPRLS